MTAGSRLLTVVSAGLLLSATLPASGAEQAGAWLGHLTWPEAEAQLETAPVVIVPFGAGAKEHGPHLPMNADEVVMNHLLEAAVQARPVVVAPPILHGWFPSFRAYPGTEGINLATFDGQHAHPNHGG